MINYSKKVLAHFRNPKNVGKIKDADGVGEVGNLVCGDVMKLYIKVDRERIEDIKFETYGCAAAIATSPRLGFIFITLSFVSAEISFFLFLAALRLNY